MKILSAILLLVTVFFAFKHGWSGIQTAMKNEPNFITAMGVSNTFLFVICAASLAVGVLVLFPQTFFIGNLISALSIVLIMSLALRAGDVKTALIEIPFLLLPLVLIWLGHPLKK